MSYLTYKGMLLASWQTHWIAVVTISSLKKDIEEYHAVMQILEMYHVPTRTPHHVTTRHSIFSFLLAS